MFLELFLHAFSEKSVDKLQDTSSVMDPGIIERFGHYHKTLSPEEGPLRSINSQVMSHNHQQLFLNFMYYFYNRKSRVKVRH